MTLFDTHPPSFPWVRNQDVIYYLPYLHACPQLREIAPEFYNNLRYRTSWSKVIYDYVTDPAMGPFNRTKRTADTRFVESKKAQ